MRTAPIQIGEITFRKVSVELDVTRAPKDGSVPADVAFDLDGVRIRTHTGFSPIEQDKASGAGFFVLLRVVIDNGPGKAGEVVKFSPYLVDVEAGAKVRVLPGAEVLGDPQNLAVVNGTSLLWSAIREQVCTLTARMPAGLVMLPTVNFRDLKRDRDASAKAKPAAKTGAKAKRPRAPRRSAAKT